MSERLECECGADINPKFQGDMGFLFHVVGGHKVTVICDRHIGPYPCCSVVEGDCLELMKSLGDSSVDLVFADPPYGIHKAEWDSVYPAGVERELLRIGRAVAMTPGQWALNQCIVAMGGAFVGIHAARNLNGMTFSPLGFGNWIPTVIGGNPSKGQDAFEFCVSDDKPDYPSPKPLEYMGII